MRKLKGFQNQAMMRKVEIALAPIVLASVYFYGWRTLVLQLTVLAFAIFGEWLFVRKSTRKISESVLVSAMLFTLTLPPSTPLWIGAVGILFGIVFGKMVFGGFGKNIFNPALVGRAFVYVSFAGPMTSTWSSHFSSGLGGFAAYAAPRLPIDALASATPMLVYRASSSLPPLVSLFTGTVNGSLGETSALLILAAGAYLVYTKTAAWQPIAGTLTGFLITSLLLSGLGYQEVLPVPYGLLSGGFLFGTLFMVTDPVSSPKTKEAKWIYGILIGCVTVIIRAFALFAGGIMFAILIGNTFAPLMDEAVKAIKKHQKERRRAHGNKQAS
jgi:Na+-transporting NADH:ubiquinone oxidoreductase subunit B